VEQESPFLRGQKRVSVRRGSLPKKAATRLTWAVLGLGAAVVCCVAVAALYHYGEHSWRFRVDSSDDLEITGVQNVTRSQVMEAMGSDIGRNIFFVPLDDRKKALEKIPWVESASVMRFVPNRLRIEIHERTPVAFARVGAKISLIDSSGTLMDLPGSGKKKYSFPVVLGMNAGEPVSTRAERMKTYNALVGELDAGGARHSQDLSEVDLSDAEDVKVLTNDPEGEVLVHLGSSNYLDRYKIYMGHVREWRQQFAKLESVDLRYDHQIIVNPDLQGPAKQTPLAPAAAKAAVAAGVKPAALISHASAGAKPALKAPVEVAVEKKAVGKAHRKAAAKAKKKANVTLAQSKTVVHPAVQSPPAPVPAPPATKPVADTSTAASSVAAKSSSKPSPAIAKGERP
jgi:cell division protein FtsQ